jgi:hypothetical protein
VVIFFFVSLEMAIFLMVVQVLGPYLWPLFLLVFVVSVPLLILMWIGDAIDSTCRRRETAYATMKPVYVARIAQGDSKRSAVVIGTFTAATMIVGIVIASVWANSLPPTPAQMVHNAFSQFKWSTLRRHLLPLRLTLLRMLRERVGSSRAPTRAQRTTTATPIVMAPVTSLQVAS